MRAGKYWHQANIDAGTMARINKIIDAEYDENIQQRVRDKAITLTTIDHFKQLPEWLAKYIVYDRHAEASNITRWKTVTDLEDYLKSFRQHSLRNPIVEQILTETLRTVKDIWQYYGEGKEAFFDEIHIELGREMKNPADERKRLTEQAAKNESTNLRIKALLAELLNDSKVENVRPYSPMQQEILKIYEDGVLNSDIEIPEDIGKISKSAQPTSSELQRYKLWLEQKYRSPYTGAVIPLNKLFTPSYEIEHVIPQSRYFDDSLSNKVICEAEVNKLKDNRTGLEFIQEFQGFKDDNFSILTENEYREFVNQHYEKNRTKKNKLLSLDIPEKMIERQLNDTRYIGKFIMQALSNIVRSPQNDDGMNSKNVLACNGQITARLKKDWGLDAVWNELILPRFERLNVLTGTTHFTVYNDRYQKYLPALPLELQKDKKFDKKRIDHRHHAMDALVIACATRNHINYLNNQNALDKNKSKEEKQKDRNDLRALLCNKKYNNSNKENYNWVFKHPWDSFVTDAKAKLETVVVSYKQNQRIINKTVNYYETTINNKKQLLKQEKGTNWAIRKPLHKDTVAGSVSLRKIKPVQLSSAFDQVENIANKDLKLYIKNLLEKGYNKKTLSSHFKDNNNKLNDLDVSKVDVYYWDNDNVASRTALDASFTKARIESITDTGIQKILLRHLADKDNNPQIAFSPEGIEEMNKNIVLLNNGKPHQPILKVRTYETKGNKFPVGQSGNKIHKYVEAAKGTNLFFAIYQDENGKRNYETVPLNIVAETQKQNLSSISELNEKGHKLLSYLSPNDLVYIPLKEGLDSSIEGKNIDCAHIYKIVSFTGSRLYAIPHTVAISIVDKVEFTQLNKMEFSLDKLSIKDNCIKLKIDRLGNIKPAS